MSTSQRSTDQKKSSSEKVVKTSDLTATVFSYADFVFASSKRPAEAELFASLVWRTKQDLTEASRLYLSPTVSKFLEAWPDRKSWIDKVLSDIRAVLIDIGAHIESVRTTRDDDEAAKRKRKFEYTLSHQKRLAQKQQTLVNTHHVLLGAIQVMQTVEQCVGLGGVAQDPIFEAPVRPWLRSESEIVRAPYSRRPSSRNLSVVSFAEVTDKYEMRHRDEPLAELSGSPSDDLLNVNSWASPSCTST
ncbi:hypothetical protein E8E11_007403 [Didymella keratinophila]|nr:hypothetical protein E8E11_007403 [Didymella keratinophila]